LCPIHNENEEEE
jgi:hypothetical protein